MTSRFNDHLHYDQARARILMLNLKLAQYRLSHYLTQRNCARCNVESGVTYNCEHTGLRDMCSECYQFIHWIGTTDMVKNEEQMK